jgi:hypothetical protein
MKVQIKNAPTKFQPIQIIIDIKSEEEFQALSTMSTFDCSIPELIEEWGCVIDKEILGNILREIRKSISKNYPGAE